MTSEEAIKIITDEELYINNYNWFENRKPDSYEIGIIKQKSQWKVYETEYYENGFKDQKNYSSENIALDNFIEKMRFAKPKTENRLSLIFSSDDMIKNGTKRRLLKWNKEKGMVF